MSKSESGDQMTQSFLIIRTKKCWGLSTVFKRVGLLTISGLNPGPLIDADNLFFHSFTKLNLTNVYATCAEPKQFSQVFRIFGQLLCLS